MEVIFTNQFSRKMMEYLPSKQRENNVFFIKKVCKIFAVKGPERQPDCGNRREADTICGQILAIYKNRFIMVCEDYFIFAKSKLKQ